MKLAEKSAEEEKALPHELIMEILRWLPAKPLAGFKCVSKLWLADIQDHSFVQKHSENLEHAYICKPLIPRQRNEETFDLLSLAYGLVLERSNLANKYRIRNPLTKQVLHLPDPMEKHLQMVLIYSPVATKYKLLYFYHKVGTKSGGFKMLTLESDLQWRNLDVPELNAGISEQTLYACNLVDGVFFVLKDDQHQIICVEIDSERAIVVENIPPASLAGAGSLSMIYWNTKVALIKMHHNAAEDCKLDVWILEDYKTQRWAQTKLAINLSLMKSFFPEATQLRVQHLIGTNLWLSVDSSVHDISYDIMDRNAVPYIRHAPRGQRTITMYRPSLAYLQGMKAEGVEASEYEVLPIP